MKVQSRTDNKKIGELVCDGAMKFVDNFAVEINGERVAEYKSLDAVAKDWEDYKPAEPLIKDEKIRKAVRAWAEALGRIKTFVVSYDVEYHDCCIYTSGLSDTAMIDLGTDLNVREGCYSITELCGDE